MATQFNFGDVLEQMFDYCNNRIIDDLNNRIVTALKVISTGLQSCLFAIVSMVATICRFVLCVC